MQREGQSEGQCHQKRQRIQPGDTGAAAERKQVNKKHEPAVEILEREGPRQAAMKAGGRAEG